VIIVCSIEFSLDIHGVTQLMFWYKYEMQLVCISLFCCLGIPSHVLYFLLLLSKNVLTALSWRSLMRFSTSSHVLELRGFPNRPKSCRIGSASRWLLFLFGYSVDSHRDSIFPLLQ
jgi:hypothetical protein